MIRFPAMSETNQPSKKPKLSDELQVFEDLFPQLMSDLEKYSLRDPETADAIKWFKEVCLYNVPHGKKNRGLTVVNSYRYLVKDPSDDSLKIARLLGWCIEFLQAYFLVADDIMDHSITRRGQPCWYKQDKVGLTAVNDSLFLESFVFQLLRKYVRDQPYYINVMELFLDANHQTVTGQCLDMITAPPEGEIDFSQYTMERYSAIVKWKTAFYSFYLPVALAMSMAGISDDDSHSRAKKILLRMGHYFQVQDDVLDCFGKPEVIGKIGTDIEDNKCCWVVVKALEMVDRDQLETLKANYGRKNPECVQHVKALYKDLDLETVFKNYEENTYQELLQLIKETSGDLPGEMFVAFANKIFKREK